MRTQILFAVMAMRDAHFYVKTAQKLVSDDSIAGVGFISFFQAANAFIESNGFRCYDAYAYVSANEHYDRHDAHEYEKLYGVQNIHAMILHEKLTSGHFDDDALERKFMAYLDGMDAILREASPPAEEAPMRLCVVQELGGFIAPLSLYFASRRRQIMHVFLEPAFFRRRLHFVLNDLYAIDCTRKASSSSPCDLQEIKRYLEQMRVERSLVIPRKDLHHFRDMALNKIVNRTNVSKLWRKLINKYLRRYRHEFDFIFYYSLQHVLMYFNRRLNAWLYARFDEDLRSSRYVYFPLHVRLDYALTIRSPEFLDQLALVDLLCRVVPTNVGVLIKEHPASIGGFAYREMRALLKKYPRLKVIHPSVNSHDLCRCASLVVTINSKAGAEALAQGKPVVVLGNAFYSSSRLVTYVDNIRALSQTLNSLLNENAAPLMDEVERFFCEVWKHTYPGELYDLGDQNIADFSDSIRRIAIM